MNGDRGGLAWGEGPSKRGQSKSEKREVQGELESGGEAPSSTQLSFSDTQPKR